MVELFSKDKVDPTRQSSKGNQMKFHRDGVWYKTDYLGYEGLAEYVISSLLAHSNLDPTEYVPYQLEQISYHDRVFNGCSSPDFSDGWQVITLERLFQQAYGHGVNQLFLEILDHRERLRALVESTERATGLQDFGIYMSKMLTIDTLFLNEDRHSHNIAIMTNGQREYKLAPFFDQGAGLLSDTTLDYPIGPELNQLIVKSMPKSFCNDFDEQLDIAEELYGRHLQFHFTYNDVKSIVDRAEMYSEEIRIRVINLVMQRRRKFEYLVK